MAGRPITSRWRIFAAVTLVGLLGLWLYLATLSQRLSGLGTIHVEKVSNGDQTGYVVENNQVIWKPLERGQRIGIAILTLGMGLHADWTRERILHTADLDSFRTLTPDHARDDARAWFRGVEIEGADMASFIALDFGFSHDATQVWRAVDPVLTRPEGLDGPVRAFSEAVFSVGTQGFALFDTLLPLPEAPQTAVIPACRDWFVMNGAVWQGNLRRLDVSLEPEVLACDGSIRGGFVGGQDGEPPEGNMGLLLRDGLALRRILRDGQVQDLGQLGAVPVETRHYKELGLGTELLFTRDADGTVQVFDLQTRQQSLGRLNALPPQTVREKGGFLIGDAYFTLNALEDPAILTAQGKARQLGDLVLAGDRLFRGTTLVANTQGQTLREMGPRMLLIGPACFNGGRYVTDVLDPKASETEIMAQCNYPTDDSQMLYDGLRIGVEADARNLGLTATPGQHRFALGDVFITNTGQTPRHISPEFLAGFDLRVARQAVDPALPADGLTLAPGETQRWPVEVSTPHDSRLVWDLSIAQTPERLAIFPEPRLRVSSGAARP